MKIDYIKQALKENLDDAAKAGFDTKKRWYHGGSAGLIKEIDPKKFGAVTGTPAAKEAFFLVDDKAVAEGFASNAKGSVHEFLYRPQGTTSIDWSATFPGVPMRSNNGQRLLAGVLQDAKDSGLAGVLIRNADDAATEFGSNANVLAVLDPSRLRYPQAAFKDNSSRDTMAQFGGAALGASAIGSAIAPDSAQASEYTPEQQAAIEAARARMNKYTPEQQAAINAARARLANVGQSAGDPSRPVVTGGRGIAGQLRAQQQYDEDHQIAAFRQQAAQSGTPYVRDLPEIGGAPELNAFNMPAFKSSLAANFTFDDKELGDILTKQVGAKIGQDVEGNYYAEMPSGGVYAINKPGFSAQDAIKFAANAAAFTPAGKAVTIPGQALMAMGTQGAIEAGQKALGGEVNGEDIAIAGAAPVVLGAALSAGKKIVDSVRPKAVSQYLDELNSQPVGATKSVEAQRVQPFFEMSGRKAAREGLKNKTVEGVGWKVGRRGALEADHLERELVRSGMSEKAVVSVNNMSLSDKEAAVRMVNLARDYVKGVKGSEARPPNSVIGESMMKRFRYVSDFQKKASYEIANAVKSSKIKLDTIDLLDGFADDLTGLKVAIDGSKMDFSLSNLANSNTSPIKTIYRRLSNSDGSFKDLHEIKQMISEQVNFAKDPTAARKISDRGESVLKALRSKINEKLREASPDYAKANDRFKEAAEAVFPFAKAMGRKFDPDSEMVDNLVGQELRKVLTNYNVGPGMIEAYQNLDNLARGLGGGFKDDIGNLIVFNSELERLGSFKAGSLQGVQEKVADRVMSRHLGGTAGELAHVAFNEAKDRVMYQAPSVETLKTLEKMQRLIMR